MSALVEQLKSEVQSELNVQVDQMVVERLESHIETAQGEVSAAQARLDELLEARKSLVGETVEEEVAAEEEVAEEVSEEVTEPQG